MRRLLHRVPSPWRTPLEWALTIGIAVALVLTLKVQVASPYRVPSSSMEPTLHCARPAEGCTSRFSDRILANRFIYRFRDPHRGEIVVFRAPAAARRSCGQGGVFVKRLIGLPGDVVSERDGRVLVNGRPLAEPYLHPERRDRESQEWPRVPAGHYFMLGDNRASSCDSRYWGTVPRANLIGPVFARYWPPDRLDVR